MERLTYVQEARGLETRPEVEEVLRKMVWSQDLDGYFEELWNEVMDRRRPQRRQDTEPISTWGTLHLKVTF